MRNTLISASALAAALVLVGCAGSAKQTAQAEAEHCFGIAKTGMNDCKAGSHSCKGMSTVDADPQSFIMVPAGTCEKLAGGSLQAKA